MYFDFVGPSGNGFNRWFGKALQVLNFKILIQDNFKIKIFLCLYLSSCSNLYTFFSPKQFIVAKSGEVGISNEHSFCEAVPVIAMADDILEKINADQYDIKESSPMDQILHIPFKLDSRLENEIDQASLKLARQACS